MSRGEEVGEARLKVAEAIGAMMEFWGFKRPMGRVWTLLFLTPEPLPAATIAEEMKMSSGAVSMTIAELSKWGVVRKTWKPGDRRDYFEAETSIWKMVTRVLRERELGMVREAAETFAEAERVLARSQVGATRDEATAISYGRQRLGELRVLAAFGERILSGLVAGEKVDPAPLRELMHSKK